MHLHADLVLLVEMHGPELIELGNTAAWTEEL